MIVALPIRAGRISPVFDVARSLTVVVIEGDREVGRREVPLEAIEPAPRARQVAELGVSVLICSAVSAPLEAMLVAAGIQVVLHVCGPAEEVLQAFVSGSLTDEMFVMPGCCGRRGRPRNRRRGGRCETDRQGDRV